MTEEEPPDEPSNVLRLRIPEPAVKPTEADVPLLARVYKFIGADARCRGLCRSFEVDYRNRVVACAHCGKEQDPFYALNMLATSVDWNEHAVRKKQEEKLVEALINEKKRLRAAVQKLRKQAGEKPWSEWET